MDESVRSVPIFEPCVFLDQDRILYGTETDMPGGTPSKEKCAAFARKTEDSYQADYTYYSAKGKRRAGQNEIECLGLPREILGLI